MVMGSGTMNLNAAPPKTPAKRIALTGGIATGKSRCLSVLRGLGVPTIDADQVARDVVAPGTTGLTEILHRFGQALLEANGTIKRDMLAGIIFGDDQARRDLEAIIHPRVYAAITQWFATLAAPAGVADIPLLYETNRAADFDIVIVAACTPAQQLERLMSRNGLSDRDARARIAAQMPLADKVARADYVIDTSGTLEDTDAATRRVWKAIESII